MTAEELTQKELRREWSRRTIAFVENVILAVLENPELACLVGESDSLAAASKRLENVALAALAARDAASIAYYRPAAPAEPPPPTPEQPDAPEVDL